MWFTLKRQFWFTWKTQFCATQNNDTLKLQCHKRSRSSILVPHKCGDTSKSVPQNNDTLKLQCYKSNGSSTLMPHTYCDTPKLSVTQNFIIKNLFNLEWWPPKQCAYEVNWKSSTGKYFLHENYDPPNLGKKKSKITNLESQKEGNTPKLE